MMAFTRPASGASPNRDFLSSIISFTPDTTMNTATASPKNHPGSSW